MSGSSHPCSPRNAQIRDVGAARVVKHFAPREGSDEDDEVEHNEGCAIAEVVGDTLVFVFNVSAPRLSPFSPSSPRVRPQS